MFNVVRRSSHVLFLCAFFVAPCLAAAPEWVEVKSPHFTVVTDTGEKRGRDVALRFEQMRAVFGELLKKAKVNQPIPMEVIAFRNGKELRQFAPLWHGKPIQLAGLFQGGSDRSFILLDMSVEEPYQVVFHEYAHQLLNGNTSDKFDPWFDEGFAEFFSTIKIMGKDAEVGLVPEGDAAILGQFSMMKVTDLFRVKQNSSTYNENGDHRSMFYAQSWLVVHFLYMNKLLPRLDPYFSLALDRGVPVEQAIQEGFGMSPSEFDKALNKYLHASQIGIFKIPAPTGIDSGTFTIRPISVLESQAVMADVHAHSPDYRDKAVEEFTEVLKAQPDNLTALRGLGFGYLYKGDYQRAGEYFEQAVKNNANDPRTLYYSALLAQREGGLSRGGTQLQTIQQRLQKAISLDPDFADAYSLLALTYMTQGDKANSLTTMLKAVNLDPRNEAYIFNLAQLYLAAQKFDESIALLNMLARSNTPGTGMRAQRELAQVHSVKQAMDSRGQMQATSGTEGDIELIGSGPPPPDTPAGPVTASASAGGPPRFIKGKLMAIDCSAPPSALLTLVAGTRSVKLHVRDSSHVIVIGADNFSCGWKDQKVAVNYRETGADAGDVISIEVQ